jgi:hypothetical protein
MSDPNLLKPELIQILEFRLIKGLMESPFDFKVKKIQSFDSTTNLELGFNQQENLVKADFTFDVSTISEENATPEARAVYQFAFIFQVENLDELVKSDDSGLTVNSNLGNAIASITYSTSRGILWSRFQGTVMENFILPVIDPNILLKKKNDDPN